MSELLIIKIGGSTLEEEDTTLKNVAGLHQQGHSMVLVHGGGKEIDQALVEKNITAVKVSGKRVTNFETLGIVVDVLDRINARLVEKLTQYKIPATGFNSRFGILKGEIEDPDLEFVGKVTKVEVGSVIHELSLGKIPVISPITTDLINPNQLLNTNADTAAAAIAINMPNSRLILMTDVPGVKGKDGAVINHLDFGHYKTLEEEGVVTSGMIPKLAEGYRVVLSGGTAQIVNLPRLLPAVYGYPVGTRLVI